MRLSYLSLGVAFGTSGISFSQENPEPQPVAPQIGASVSSAEMEAIQERLRALELELEETKETLQSSESRFDSFLKDWKEKGDPEVDVAKSQASDKKEGAKDEKKKEKKWFEKLGIRGYSQFRLNDVLREEVRPGPTGWRSIGWGQSIVSHSTCSGDSLWRCLGSPLRLFAT